MLLVKTEVRESPIAGVGLFAAENIKKGQLVWSYSPDSCSIITEQQMKELAQSYDKHDHALIKYYLTYGYYVKNLNGVVLCLDNGRYINHSDIPNMSAIISLEQPLDMLQMSYAHRDIKKGEELTESYALFDNAPWWNDMCEIHHVFNDSASY